MKVNLIKLIIDNRKNQIKNLENTKNTGKEKNVKEINEELPIKKHNFNCFNIFGI